MKKFCFLVALLTLLSGCAAQQTFETVNDVYAVPASVTMHRLQLDLPTEAASAAMEADGESLYFCDGYTVCIQTLEAGDLSESLRQLTGFPAQALTVLQTARDNVRRYDTVWTAAGEGGDQTGRLTLLDDGSYHYAVTVMADAAVAGSLTDTWNQLLASAELVSTG